MNVCSGNSSLKLEKNTTMYWLANCPNNMKLSLNSLMIKYIRIITARLLQAVSIFALLMLFFIFDHFFLQICHKHTESSNCRVIYTFLLRQHIIHLRDALEHYSLTLPVFFFFLIKFFLYIDLYDIL